MIVSEAIKVCQRSSSKRFNRNATLRPKRHLDAIDSLLESLVSRSFADLHCAAKSFPQQLHAITSSLKVGNAVADDDDGSIQSGRYSAIIKCLGRLQELEKVETSLSVTVNWGYWRLGTAYQAFSNVSFRDVNP